MPLRIGSNGGLVGVAVVLTLASAGFSQAETPAQPSAIKVPAYEWQLPPGFPPPRVPADNLMSDAKVSLGRRLFFDTRLSVNGSYSCASCHRPELAYTDARVQAVGTTGERVRRNAMSLTNVAYNASFTWASRAVDSLEAQMRTPLFGTHPIEMGLNADDAKWLELLAADAAYVSAFHESFSEPSLTLSNVVKAIAAFERTLISGRSAFDKYVFDDQRDALTPAARRGMKVFFSERSGCSHCHFGLNFSGPIVHERTANKVAAFANTGLYNVDGAGSYPQSDNGLIEETHAVNDTGRFRVPTLRNIALTAPYMHDGSVATLDAVLDHYNAGGRESQVGLLYSDSNIRPLALTADEKLELVEFLRSLTDDAFVSAGKAMPSGER